MSKATAAEEAKKRGESSTDVQAVKEEKEKEKGGLSRFARHGSISLRGKPKLFGGKDKDKEAGLPTLQQVPGELPAGSHEAAPMSPAAGEAKKNRFSLGRKKSNGRSITRRASRAHAPSPAGRGRPRRPGSRIGTASTRGPSSAKPAGRSVSAAATARPTSPSGGRTTSPPATCRSSSSSTTTAARTRRPSAGSPSTWPRCA